jgi:hypothetical protein
MLGKIARTLAPYARTVATKESRLFMYYRQSNRFLGIPPTYCKR